MTLLEYLPYRLQVGEIKAFMEAMEPHRAALSDARADFPLQLHVATATWGLALWEEILGITTDVSKTDDTRRAVIYAALRGAGTTTVAVIQAMADSFGYGEVTVTEITDEYRVAIAFVETFGVPDNLDELDDAIGAVIPAHLAYEFIIRYALWGDYDGLKWSDLEGHTWYELENGGAL